MTRIVLVDDHTLVRAGIRSLVEGIAGVEVVAEAGDGAEGLEAARSHDAEVVITDIAMPGMNGLELTERISLELPRTKVIVLSMYSSEEYVLRALQAGAKAFLLKDSATQELEIALAAVLQGKTYLAPGASQRVVERYIRAPDQPASPLDVLTARQREVLRLIAEGVNTKEIAYRLQLSSKTVESHRAAIMERLNIRDLAGLVRFAVRAGLVSPDE